jgi:hypothetical protein
MVDWIKEGKTVVILTVFSGTRKRAADAQNYADLIGAQWEGFGAVEGEPLDDIKFDPLPGLLGMLYDARDVTIISPAGIQHPEHKAVRQWVFKSYACHFRGSKEYYYVEIPYYTKLKNQPEVNDIVQGSTVESIKKPKHYKADEKYWKCFKDQSKFFHFNPAAGMKDIPELIVSEDTCGLGFGLR